MHRYQLRDIHCNDPRPHGFDFCSIRQRDPDLGERIWRGSGMLGQHHGIVRAGDYLPFEYTTLFESLGGMNADEIPAGRDQLAKMRPELAHRVVVRLRGFALLVIVGERAAEFFPVLEDRVGLAGGVEDVF